MRPLQGLEEASRDTPFDLTDDDAVYGPMPPLDPMALNADSTEHGRLANGAEAIGELVNRKGIAEFEG